MSDTQKPTQQQVLEKARLAQAQANAQAEARQKTKSVWLLVGLATVGLVWMLYSQGEERAREADAEAAALAPCKASDAACYARKLSGRIQRPCSEAIERKLVYRSEWTDGIAHTRFSNATWYLPTKEIIFTGDAIMVQNAFGAERRADYFCVVSVATGAVIKAGFPGG